MTSHFLWKRLLLLIIILRASAGDSGYNDYQANGGDGNVDSQANTGDVTGWLMAEGAHYNTEGPVQAQFHDGQASPLLVSDSGACSMHGTYDIQGGSSDLQFHNKGGAACKNDSPPTMERKTKPVRGNEDIVIPDAMPRWPIMQLEPNRQSCDHEIYSVPACAEKEGAKFVSLFLYDLPVCRPCMLFLYSFKKSHRPAHLHLGIGAPAVEV